MRFTKLFPSVRFLSRGLNYGKVVTRRCSSGGEGAEKKGCCICVYEKNNKLELTPVGAELDQKCDGQISQQLNTLSNELKLGKAFALTNILGYSAVAITSIGPKDACYDALESLDEARENIRWGVGAGVKLLKKRGCATIEVDPCTAADAAAEAAELAAWRFEAFKSPEVQKPPCVVGPLGGDACAQAPEWREGAVRGAAQNWARCLADMPANWMTPVDLAQAALDCLCPLGVTVEAHDREWIEAQRMRAFLAVARGSCAEPVFLDCSYRGAAPDAPSVLLAAKGVTFDSGGLCLKEAPSMMENRGSMAGAAVVLAALQIIAKLKVPVNVSAVIPICENMVSGQCMKVGDVVQALNGLSIQIENTDMEGRLMMADALVYGQSIYKPSLVIDVATFTHGVLMATGGGAFGCFSNSDAAWRAVQCAGACSGDRPWRFPLWQYFQNQITNDRSVDLRNKGSGHATPCLGAAFLKNFICGDWVHMDITGVGKVAHAGAPPYLHTRRMTGRPTRTLAVMIQQIAAASNLQQPHTSPSCPPSSLPNAGQPYKPSSQQGSQRSPSNSGLNAPHPRTFSPSHPEPFSPNNGRPMQPYAPSQSGQLPPSQPETQVLKAYSPNSSGPRPPSVRPQPGPYSASNPGPYSPDGSGHKPTSTPLHAGQYSSSQPWANAPSHSGPFSPDDNRPKTPCAPYLPEGRGPKSPGGSPGQSCPTSPQVFGVKQQTNAPSTQTYTPKPQSCVPTKHKCS